MEKAVEILEKRVNELFARLEYLDGEVKRLERENKELKDKRRFDYIRMRKILDTLENLGL